MQDTAEVQEAKARFGDAFADAEAGIVSIIMIIMMAMMMMMMNIIMMMLAMMIMMISITVVVISKYMEDKHELSLSFLT